MALDPKLQKFTTASPVLANYSYKDVASGLGYIEFYLVGAAGGTYKLHDFSGYTDTVKVLNNAVFTFNSSTFNSPRTISGNGIFETSHRIQASGSNRSMTIVGVLKLVSDTTTTLCTFTTISDTSTTNKYFNGLSVNAISQIHVKKGDYLQLEVTLGGSSGYGWLYIDPTNSESSALGSTKIRVPFKIEV